MEGRFSKSTDAEVKEYFEKLIAAREAFIACANEKGSLFCMTGIEDSMLLYSTEDFIRVCKVFGLKPIATRRESCEDTHLDWNLECDYNGILFHTYCYTSDEFEGELEYEQITSD